MNGIIKRIVIFAAGAAAGVLGSAGYFYKKSVKACNEYEEKCSAEYEELRARFDKSKDYRSESLEKARGDNSEKTSEAPAKGKVDYTQYVKPNVTDVIKRAESKVAEEEGPMEETNRSVKLRGPRLIKAEDYGNDRTLDMVELFYYTDNDVLTNEDDEVIAPDTVELLIGNALTKFKFNENPDENYIYVRNEKHGCDYQITKIHAQYNLTE